MKTHRKTLIALLIFCMAIHLAPSIVFAVTEPIAAERETNMTEPSGSATEQASEAEGPEGSADKDMSADEMRADDDPDGKTEGSEKESKDREEQTPGSTSAGAQDLKETEPEADPAAPEGLMLKKAPMRATAGSEQINYTASRPKSSIPVIFRATINGKQYKGTCNECGIAWSSSGTMTVVDIGKEDLRRKVAYKYGSWLEVEERNYSMGGVYKGICLEAMLQYARAWMDDKKSGGSGNRTAVVSHWRKSNGGNGWSESTCTKITDAVKALDSMTAADLGIPNSFRAYHGIVENVKNSEGRTFGQDPVFWGALVTGGISIKKVPESGREEYVAAHPEEFDLTGAKYQLWTDAACTVKATDVNWNDAVLTTKADGTTNELTMEIGDYYLTEIQKPAKGFGLDTDKVTGEAAIHKEIIKENKTTVAVYAEPVEIFKNGSVKIIKSSEASQEVLALSGYSVANAKYQIYTDASCTDASKATTADGSNALLTTNAAGESAALEMNAGNYWLKEVKSPNGHKTSQQPIPFSVTAGGTVNPADPHLNTGDTVSFNGWREGSGGGETALFNATAGARTYTGTCAQSGVSLSRTGSATVTKIGNDTKIAKAIYHYAYELGDDNWWTSSHRLDNVGSIINVSGTQFTKRKLLECFCQIHNMGAQTWYNVNTNAGVATATARAVRNYYANLDVSGVTVPDNFEILLSRPADSSQQFIMWRMASAGAVVLNVSDTPIYGEPNLRVFKTATDGNFSYDKLTGARFVIKYYDVATKAEIASAEPAREWAFTTVKKDAPESAPAGTYLAGFDWRTDEKSSGDEFYKDESGNRVIPLGWFTIEETAAPTGFKLTNTKCYGQVKLASDGKSATTVIEGAKSDERLHMETFVFTDEPYGVTVSKKNAATGAGLAGAQLQILQGSTVVVPTWTTTTTPKAVEGLAPGTYTLREIKAPYGYEIADDVTFTVDGKSDKTVTMSDTPVSVSTIAVDATTQKHIGTRKTSSKITDTVHMTGLVKDRKYRLTGVLMNKRTGQAVPNVTVSPKEFTATAATMDVTMDFTFDSTSLADGDSVVVYETLYRMSRVHSGENVPSGGIELAKHEDINDAAQTIYIPIVKTTAAISDDNRIFTDTISYGNLLPGRKYVFRGWLVDTATGTKIKGSDGKVELTASETNTSGSVKMEMKTEKYDDMHGHSMTAFEELYIVSSVSGSEKEILIAEHKDKNDSKQTVGVFHDLKIKKIVTGNLGDITKKFEFTAEFNGLVPGEAYSMEGDDEKTFMADSSGRASVPLLLKGGQEAMVRDLPKGATYKVTEAASDHIASYKMYSEDMAEKGAKIVKAEDSNGSEEAKALATATETVDLFDGTVVILFENNRDLAAITGYAGIDYRVYAAVLAVLMAGTAFIVISGKNRRRRSA